MDTVNLMFLDVVNNLFDMTQQAVGIRGMRLQIAYWSVRLSANCLQSTL